MSGYLSSLKEIVEALALGYIVIGAIFVCSVVATTVFLERLWYLRVNNVLPRRFLIEVQELIRRGKMQDAESLCRQSDSPLSRILLVGLSLFSQDGGSRIKIRERVEDSGRQEAHRLEGPSEILGTIAGIAPLLGLLGTVLGMIEIFGVISTAGVGNATLLASGIATALITTVFGIGVAIPSLVAYKYCMGRARALVLELEKCTAHALELALGLSSS